MKRILITLFFFWGMKACAQDAPNFYFTTPFNLESGKDFGVPNGNRTVNATSVVLTAPTFTLLKPSPRGDLSFGYRPEFAWYNANSGLNSWNHAAMARWDYRISARLTFDLNDGFVSTRDNARRFDSAFILPAGRYDENSLYVGLAYQLRANTAVKIRYDNSWVKFDSQKLAAPINFNVLSNGVQTTVEQKLTGKLKIAGNYGYLRSHSLDKYDVRGLPVAPILPSHYVGATFDYQIRPSLLFEAGGGWVKNQFNSYTGGGLLEKHFSRLVLSGGYSRYLSLLGAAQPAVAPGAVITGQVSPFGQFGSSRQLANNSMTQTASFHAIGPLTRNISISANVLASRTGITTAGGQPLESLIAGLRLDYKLNDRFGIFTEQQLFAQTKTSALPLSLSRKRVMAGIQYTFSPSPDEIARHIDAIHSNDTTAAPAGDAAGPTPQEKH